jgi:hypothetical protein
MYRIEKATAQAPKRLTPILSVANHSVLPALALTERRGWLRKNTAALCKCAAETPGNALARFTATDCPK